MASNLYLGYVSNQLDMRWFASMWARALASSRKTFRELLDTLLTMHDAIESTQQ